MSELKILRIPHKKLLSPCAKINKFDLNLQKLISDMIETMQGANGIGLAANQVGKDLKLVIIEAKKDIIEKRQEKTGTDYKPIYEEVPLTVLINPKIISHGAKIQKAIEGCLSVPGTEAEVERFLEIKVLAQNQKGERIKFKAKGLFARIIQHELDHLNGVLIIRRGKEVEKEEK